jgi:hypothetical protein
MIGDLSSVVLAPGLPSRLGTTENGKEDLSGEARQSEDWSFWSHELRAEAKLDKAKTGRFPA